MKSGTYVRNCRTRVARARASGKPSVLHCLLDPEAITPGSTLRSIRDAALAASDPR